MNSKQLIAAYLAAEYLIPTDGVRLRIGVPAPGLDVAYPGVTQFALLTAWNPASRSTGAAANFEAEQALDKQLAAHGLRFIPALNKAPGGGYEEPSRLLLECAPALLDRLACAFGQAGALAWERGGPVRLRIYPREWRAAAAVARVDTRFVDWVACAPP